MGWKGKSLASMQNLHHKVCAFPRLASLELANGCAIAWNKSPLKILQQETAHRTFHKSQPAEMATECGADFAIRALSLDRSSAVSRIFDPIFNRRVS